MTNVVINRTVLKLMYPLFCCSTGVFTAAFDCQIEWLIVKGIADFADRLASESWLTFASVMAASLVAHILNDSCVFRSWPHYQGNHFIKCCYFLACDLLNPLVGFFLGSPRSIKIHCICTVDKCLHLRCLFRCPILTSCSSHES